MSGFAVFSLKDTKNVAAETVAPGSPARQRGRIYVENRSGTRTRFVIVNPNDRAVTIEFFFTDTNGVDRNRGSIYVPAHRQVTEFLDEAPFNAHSFTGTFSFASTLPVAAMGIQEQMNQKSESLTTVLPIAELSGFSTVPSAIPQFFDGGGWTASVLLVNPSDAPISGSVRFFAGGSGKNKRQSMTVLVNGVNGKSGSSFPYSIPPRSSTVPETSGGSVMLNQDDQDHARFRTATPVSLTVSRLRMGAGAVRNRCFGPDRRRKFQSVCRM
jgi:hypothetical protein